MSGYLASPNRKADEFLDALQKLREQAWYLHREDQRFFIKETENLSRQIERSAKEIPQPKIDQALINRLQGVRRQTLWGHLALILRDTFLPIASPV